MTGMAYHHSTSKARSSVHRLQQNGQRASNQPNCKVQSSTTRGLTCFRGRKCATTCCKRSSTPSCQLCHDICEYNDLGARPKFVVWGAPQDYRSWEIDPLFLEEWGWLLVSCTEVFQTTNYWRVKRGEKMLAAQEWQTAIQRSIPTRLME
jgi:hypothetical protein